MSCADTGYRYQAAAEKWSIAGPAWHRWFRVATGGPDPADPADRDTSACPGAGAGAGAGAGGAAEAEGSAEGARPGGQRERRAAPGLRAASDRGQAAEGRSGCDRAD